MESLDVSGVKTLSGLLEQLPSGNGARALAARLGVWTEEAHADPTKHRRSNYPKEFSSLGPNELSNTNAYWLSEAARATELVGLLEGQKIMLGLYTKQARAAVRGRLRKAAVDTAEKDGSKPVKYTVAELNDEAEADTAVLEIELKAALLEQTLASTKAYKEACLALVAGISREISFRQAQMSARLRD